MAKELTPELIKKLKAPLPEEAIGEHPTKTFLSTIKAIYVVERLNEVFGIGKWKQTSQVIDHSSKMVIVQSQLIIAEYGIELESYGGNDNPDKGDAFKGASTDALTKMCSCLEIGMDVFKGKATKPASKPDGNKDQDNRPWLSEQLLVKVLKRIEDGDVEAKENAFKAYKMKKEYKEQILAA